MSIFDDFRGLTAELFDAFDLPVATITRTTEGERTKADKAAGRKGLPTIATLTGRGVLAKRNLKLENGTIVSQSIAKLSVAAKRGDKLKLGNFEGDVIETEEVAPDGGAPFIVIAVLK